MDIHGFWPISTSFHGVRAHQPHLKPPRSGRRSADSRNPAASRCVACSSPTPRTSPCRSQSAVSHTGTDAPPSPAPTPCASPPPPPGHPRPARAAAPASSPRASPPPCSGSPDACPRPGSPRHPTHPPHPHAAPGARAPRPNRSPKWSPAYATARVLHE